jgi:hypothetical protein
VAPLRLLARNCFSVLLLLCLQGRRPPAAPRPPQARRKTVWLQPK